MSEPAPNVHQWANQLRQEARATYGEKEFARRMLEFVELLPEADQQTTLSFVLRFVAKTHQQKYLHFAIIWLDGIGQGQLSTAELAQQIKALRQIAAQPSQTDSIDKDLDG